MATRKQARDGVVIVGIARTPIGALQGALASFSAPEIGGHAIRAAVERAGLPAEAIGETLMGCILTAGLGQAPARQAAILAGLPPSVPATTVNKMCGSGMQTLIQAADALQARPNHIIVAGGMESMTNAPYLLPRMRSGARLGHGEVKDHMLLDGLEDAYDKGTLMGQFAEETARHYQLSRAEQDAFAVESLRRARRASEDGSFAEEIVPIVAESRKGTLRITRDEQPFTADVARIPTLKPAFRPDGTITAANASSISDGAAALVVMREAEARRRSLRPLARVVATATHAQEPAWYTTAPAPAVRKVLAAAGWTAREVDLFEINEAFAVVAIAAMRDLGLEHDKVNVHGGACALGHPIGASGARIVVTLLAAMRRRGAARGVAAVCIGGGEATAVAIERLD
ncbi:MAG: acetyl-CoA C-acyltransferase [Pseudomonadota bacterium]